jgi:hypothetical protein
VRTEEGKSHLFVAINRTSKFAFTQLPEKANRHTAAAFLKDLIAVVPIRFMPCSLITAFSSAICRKTTQFRQPGGEPIYSICSAVRTRSSIGSQSQTTRGRTDRSSG